MHDDVNYLQTALNAGASGYVLKKAADTELLMGIRAVLRGETYIHSAMTKKLLQNVASPHSEEKTSQDDDPWKILSEREFNVMRLIALGYTNTEVADELFLSVKTVETYRARGMEKLNLQTRAQLVQSALKHGHLD
jgi:DNA-binding NarL/FixJ family response regulator